MATGKKIKYGVKSVEGEVFDSKQPSIRISLVMEADLLKAIKKDASETGRSYQTELKRVALTISGIVRIIERPSKNASQRSNDSSCTRVRPQKRNARLSLR